MTGLTLISAHALPAGAALAQDVGRPGSEGACPPGNVVGDAGEVELGDELCARADLTCEGARDAWDSIVPSLVSENHHAAMSRMNITDERDEVIGFTQANLPRATSASAAVSPDADREGGTVAAQTNAVRFARVAGTGATLLEFATPEGTIAAMKEDGSLNGGDRQGLPREPADLPTRSAHG